MTAVMTYNSLVEDMKNYAQRGSTTDTRYITEIPRLIAKAEYQLAQDAKTLLDRPPITGNLTPMNPIVKKPARTRNTVSFNIGIGADFDHRRLLFNRPYEYIRLYWSAEAEVCDPKFYADYDVDHWIVAPTPDRAYPFEVIVDQRVQPLDDAHQTNVYTIQAPNLLLEACMLQADIFLQNWERVGIRREQYRITLNALMGEQQRRTTDKTQKTGF